MDLTMGTTPNLTLTLTTAANPQANGSYRVLSMTGVNSGNHPVRGTARLVDGRVFSQVYQAGQTLVTNLPNNVVSVFVDTALNPPEITEFVNLASMSVEDPA
jgi:hypothetical protein